MRLNAMEIKEVDVFCTILPDQSLQLEVVYLVWPDEQTQKEMVVVMYPTSAAVLKSLPGIHQDTTMTLRVQKTEGGTTVVKPIATIRMADNLHL